MASDLRREELITVFMKVFEEILDLIMEQIRSAGAPIKVEDLRATVLIL